MGDVVVLGGFTKLDIPAERVLNGAKDLEDVLVLGWDKDGKFYAATNIGGKRSPEVVDLANRFIHKYYAGDYDD